MYSDSALSLLVPIVVIAMVLITKRVVLSLFLGIVLAGIMLEEDLYSKMEYVYMAISGVFYDEASGIKINTFYIFGFLVLLGILTQLMQCSGGINAFVQWARKRINSPKGSEFLAFIAGIVIFIDDYFNALSVGQIARPLNDANHSTRERLAYIIDSTSAPVCILMPISSWGAYVLGLMSGLVEGQSAFSVLVESIIRNYYAWFALIGVFFVIYWQINLPVMKNNQNIGAETFEEIKVHTSGNMWLLITPIVSLIFLVAFFIFYSGYREVQTFDFIAMLGEAQTGFSLFWGGFFALLIALLISFKHINGRDFYLICKDGFLSMLPAILILVLAWAIGPVIKDDLQTGTYLSKISADFIVEANLSPNLIVPLALFLSAGFIALCMGTSWGTFAIMLPIGVSIASANGADVMLAIAAVLGGAVYGDHVSPISDTTILSATGAGCSVQSHFITQLPYASMIAFVAFISYGVAGLLNSFVVGYVVGWILLFSLFLVLKRYYGEKLLRS